MSETIQPGTTPPARRRRVIAAAAVGVTAVVVGAVLLLGGGEDREDPTGAAPAASSPASTPSPSPSPAATTPEPTPTPDASPTATAAPEPAPSEEQPAPGAESVVPLPPLTAEPPQVVPLDAPAEVGTSVTARLVAIEDVTSTGTGVGEFSGPAYQVTVEVTGGAEAVDLTTVAVAAYLGEDGTPASPVFTDERSAPLTGTLVPGASARGTYVFAAPPEQRGILSVTVLAGLDPQMVVFQGDPANRPG